MSNCPAAHAPQGTGSGRRTTPTTRSPTENRSEAEPGSTTRPSDSWPSTSRASPDGAQPYSPPTISMSVPHTPSASPSTSSSLSPGTGSGSSTTAAEPADCGATVSARTSAHPGELPRVLVAVGAEHVHDRVDLRQVGERLREVAEVAARAGIDLLRVQLERRGIRQHL